MPHCRAAASFRPRGTPRFSPSCREFCAAVQRHGSDNGVRYQRKSVCSLSEAAEMSNWPRYPTLYEINTWVCAAARAVESLPVLWRRLQSGMSHRIIARTLDLFVRVRGEDALKTSKRTLVTQMTRHQVAGE